MSTLELDFLHPRHPLRAVREIAAEYTGPEREARIAALVASRTGFPESTLRSALAESVRQVERMGLQGDRTDLGSTGVGSRKVSVAAQVHAALSLAGFFYGWDYASDLLAEFGCEKLDELSPEQMRAISRKCQQSLTGTAV